jgi:NADH-quinone oxidoreductase subunit G
MEKPERPRAATLPPGAVACTVPRRTPMAKDVTLTIDGVSVTIAEGTLLVEAAKRIDTEVPVYCYHPKLGPAGLCRICLVDVEKTPKLQIACNTVATEGMVVHTRGAKVEEGRRAVLEFLLLNHPLDCPICDKGGECDLQDFSMAYGQGASRKAEAKLAKPKAVDLGPTIVLDEERCIVCQRCVRFDDVITREQSLVVKDRGAHDIIATATDDPYVSNFSGNVTELCPVGALTSKTYRFRSRPWDLNRTQTTCTQCAVGCQLNVDVRHGDVLRTMSVAEDATSDGWLCDRGRYNIGFYADARRLTSPLLRDGEEWLQIGWDDAIEIWGRKIREAIAQGGPGAVAAIGGGRLLNEEAYLLQHVFRALGVQNLDWRAGRQRTAGHDVPGTYLDLENAQVIVTYGRPPSQLAPIMDLRIRKAVEHRGAMLFSLGDHRAAAFVPETHVASVDELRANLPKEYDRIAVIWDGCDGPLSDAFAAFCRETEASGRSVSAFIVAEQPNARGAEAMGMLPSGVGLDTRGIFESARDGKLRVLSLFGVNPVLRFADGALARAALEGTPFVVVSELFMTETAERASLILPARGPFEKDGHVFDLTGAVQIVNAGHAAPTGTLTDGEMLVALASELGVDVPTPRHIETNARSYKPAVARPADETIERPSRAPSAEAALRVAVAANIFAGGGTVRFDDAIAELRPLPTATFGPRTAASSGVAPGDRIDLVAGDRALRDLAVRVDREGVEDVVRVVDGLPGAPANVLADGEAVAVANVRAGREFALAGAG